MVITQNGRPTAVVLTPEEFEELGYRAFVRAQVAAGVESAKHSETLTPAEMRAHFAAKKRRAR
jgi:hypothetical protein